MWYSLLIASLALAITNGEKLGDIEVITRGELGSGGLVPPDRDPTEQPILLTQAKANILSSEEEPEHRFIPPPALSYLPPVKTPLPIESTEAPTVTSSIVLSGEYLPPRGVADEIRQVVETPNTLYSAPNPQPAIDPVPILTEPPVPVQAQPQGLIYPVGFAAGAQQPPLPFGLPPSDDGYYLEEEGKGGFFSGIRDSKLTLLGGIVGAKSAVLQGLRNAKESIASGVSGAITHKATALSSLKTGIQNTFTGGNTAEGSYSDVSQDGYGSNTNVGVAGSSGAGTAGNVYPIPLPLPLPPIPVPILVPVKPVSSYPSYPPYAESPYPVPRPVYRPKPNPFAGLKAKFDSLVQAKRSAVAGAIEQVDAAKENFRHSFSGIFNKGTPAFLTTYPRPHYDLKPLYPNYSSGSLIQSNPSVFDVFHQQPQTYPSYHRRPGYVYDAPQSPPTAYAAGLTEKFEAKKAAISRAISSAVAKLKAPFPHFYPSPYYYRRW